MTKSEQLFERAKKSIPGGVNSPGALFSTNGVSFMGLSINPNVPNLGHGIIQSLFLV